MGEKQDHIDEYELMQKKKTKKKGNCHDEVFPMQ